MTTTEQTRTRNRRRTVLVIGGVLAVAVVVGAVFVVRELLRWTKPAPEFTSLQAVTDPSLEGTVAYFDSTTNCVRVVSASGARSKDDVLCVEPGAFDTGPQLAFLPGGRLEVTMFEWPTDEELRGLWQKVVDVRTGEVEDVPAAEVPEQPEKTPVPAVGPNGELVTADSSGGTLEVTLEDDSGTRTLLDTEGNPEYGVTLGGDPIWSPSGEWIVLNDGRLLLITVDDPAQTRIIVPEPGGVGGYGSAEIRIFAVTDAELISPAP